MHESIRDYLKRRLRRVHRGMSCDRCGRQYPIQARGRSAVEAGERSRRPAMPAFPQRPGVSVSSGPALGGGGKHRYRLPDKPLQNGSNGSFNEKLCDECLGMRCFEDRIDAKIRIEELLRELTRFDRARVSDSWCLLSSSSSY
jgi:Integrase core domain